MYCYFNSHNFGPGMCIQWQSYPFCFKKVTEIIPILKKNICNLLNIMLIYTFRAWTWWLFFIFRWNIRVLFEEAHKHTHLQVQYEVNLYIIMGNMSKFPQYISAISTLTDISFFKM